MYQKSWVDSRTSSIPFVLIATNFSKEPPNKQSAEKKKCMPRILNLMIGTGVQKNLSTYSIGRKLIHCPRWILQSRKHE
jgi:hypothetical protein